MEPGLQPRFQNKCAPWTTPVHKSLRGQGGGKGGLGGRGSVSCNKYTREKKPFESAETGSVLLPGIFERQRGHLRQIVSWCLDYASIFSEINHKHFSHVIHSNWKTKKEGDNRQGEVVPGVCLYISPVVAEDVSSISELISIFSIPVVGSQGCHLFL